MRPRGCESAGSAAAHETLRPENRCARIRETRRPELQAPSRKKINARNAGLLRPVSISPRASWCRLLLLRQLPSPLQGRSFQKLQCFPVIYSKKRGPHTFAVLGRYGSHHGVSRAPRESSPPRAQIGLEWPAQACKPWLSRPFHIFGHVFLKLLCLWDGRACAAFD